MASQSPADSGRPSAMQTRHSAPEAMTPTPAARPSSPSMRFMAFVMPTIQTTVMTLPRTPSVTQRPVKGLVSPSIP